MLNYKCVFATLSLLCFQLGSSTTGVCTRNATAEEESYTEECCPGYSGNPPNCTRLCADLSPPSNGNVSVTTYEIGGRATYTCNLYSGFELLGMPNRTCLSNGTWSGLEPICNYTILCPHPDPPGNGSVFVSKHGDQLGSAWYTCNSGYRLSGSSQRSCQPSGNWSGTQPSCIRSCSHLRLVHGSISVTTYDVGGSATYNCDIFSGYFLSGPSTRTCLPNGNWSGSEPTCNHTVVCPNLDDPSNGSVSVDSTFYGGRAHYSCNPGYRLSGLTYRTCQLSGRWTGIPPVCIKTCSRLSSPRYGLVFATSHVVGGRATYICNSGFRLVGSSTRTCLSDGSWSGSQPICNYTLSVFCPDVDPPSNGTVSLRSKFVGDRAYYHCNSGYQRSGPSSRTCLLSGRWNQRQPTCIRTCSSPSSPRYGRVYVNYHDVGGRATYSCNSGFRLVGSSTRTCLSDGSWSGSQPTCNYTLSVFCPDLDPPSNGTVSLRSNFVGERASYYCNSGYRRSGSSSTTCLSSGQWSRAQPTCIRTCSYLSSSRYGRVSVTTRDVGGRATYTCNSGFKLIGSSNRTCLSDGSWSGSQPICNYTVLCPNPDDPGNGSVSVSANFVGGYALYRCNSGYRLSGYSYHTCQLSGTWSSMQPTCIRTCVHPSSPRYGRVFVTTHNIGGRATYNCKSGFSLVGPSNRTCLSDGSWSGAEPICNYTLSVFCPDLDPPSNGTVIQRSNFVAETARYHCNSGYRRSGYSYRTCQSSGNWSRTQPTCIKTCRNLRYFSHGRVSMTTSDVGGRATYTCNSGFSLVGSPNRTCLSDGSWSGWQPICNYTVLCPNLDDPGNGSISFSDNYVGGSASYSCNSGYRLSGFSYRTCQLSGTWSRAQPRCIRTCSYLSSPSYGYVSVTTRDVGGRATYSCNSGFGLVGSSNRTCLSDGSWSGSPPICNYTVWCPNPDNPGNGSVLVHSNFFGGEAYYSCNSGYRRNGPSYRTCQLSGTWSRTQPRCIRTCDYLSSPQYGSVYVTTRDAGGRATYTCNYRFSLVGSSTRTCLSDGSWSGSQPICNYTLSVFCPDLDPPSNGSVFQRSNFVDETAYYSCNSGYRLSGSSYTTCLISGQWSGTLPTCIRTCSYLSSPSYGHVSVTTHDVRGRATYTCNDGFRLVGSSNRTCLSDGSWSGSQPICNYTVLCPSLVPPTHGYVSVSSSSNFLGGSAYYGCDHGYRLSGSSYRYCQASEEWSGTQPTCIRRCDYLSSPSYGRVSVTTRDVGGRATYTCNDGFRLIGSSNRTCLSNGIWSGSQPICNNTVLCPSPDQPDDGSVSVSSMFVGGRARYSCRYGYQLFGPSIRYCQLSGEWSGVQPTCARRCSYPSYPRNGLVSVTTRVVGGRATYTCNSGFRLVGSSTRTCLSSGSWSGSEPTCIRILRCSYPSSPSYGRVYVTTRDVGGRATYTCNSGFRLVGSSSRICLSSGSWSGSEPTCIRNPRCSYPSSPSYGRVYVTTRNVGDRATYTCNSGCRLVGSSSRICLSSGYWSGSQPICNCQADGDLRLVSTFGSVGGSSGRLEIYHNSQWGTVCVDSFGSTDADVACRQLGYTRASNYGRVERLGFSRASSSTRTWLANVHCSGSESRLAYCNHNGYGIADCTHSQDVALICTSSITVPGTGSTSYNVVGVTVGVSVGGTIFITIAVILCVFCCSVCVAKSSSSARTVLATPPTRTPTVINYTTTQPTYPLQQLYSAAPQQPPTANPAAQVDPKEPTNPEFSSEAPPSYTHASNFPAYLPPAYAYIPVNPTAGYPPFNSNTEYPHAESSVYHNHNTAL